MDTWGTCLCCRSKLPLLSPAERKQPAYVALLMLCHVNTFSVDGRMRHARELLFPFPFSYITLTVLSNLMRITLLLMSVSGYKFKKNDIAVQALSYNSSSKSPVPNTSAGILIPRNLYATSISRIMCRDGRWPRKRAFDWSILHCTTASLHL